MGKHRLRESLKSIFESHIDLERDEELKGTKTEIEGKVKKILKLIKDKDDDTNGNTREYLKKEPLVEFIEDIQNHYQSLYDRYDNLTGDLRKKVNSAKGKDSSSSSSSDSDNSPKKKGSKNGKKQKNIQNIANGIKEELDTANVEVADLKSKLKAAIEEKESLYTEFEDTLNKVQEEVKMKNDLTIEADKLNDENSKLLAENTDLNSRVEWANKLEAEMDKKLEKKSEDISEYFIQIENLKEELASKLLDEMRGLEEREGLKAQVKDLELKADSLCNMKSNLEEQMKNKIQEIEHLRGENEGLLQRISELEEATIERGNQFFAIQKKLEDEKNEASGQIRAFIEQIETLKHDLNSLHTEKTKLDSLIESKDQKIGELEETIEDLKEDVEIKGEEMSTLVENVSNSEVKLRLSNQKLRVTEQLLNETEEIYMEKEAKLREQNRLLEVRNSMLSGTITAYKEAQIRVIADVTDKVNDTLTGIDTLTVKFEEDFGHIETCIFEIFNELQVAKRWVKEANGTKEELKKEMKDTKDDELRLRERMEELVRELQKGEEEKENVMRDVKRVEEKVKELERKMKEKDMEISGLEEEKREAIRQLCICIDYRRSQCDDLKEMVSKMSGGRRQVRS
ncbi:hypothetical protein LguiA_015749 [Lonicera macranthoides]